jgi:arginine-tRNA-protein transferase
MLRKSDRTSTCFTESHPCPYFSDNRISSTEYLINDHGSAKEFHILLSKGYRRFGQVFYKNVCVGCRECKSLRIDVDRFRPGRSHKRTIKNNADMRVEIVRDAAFSLKKLALYEKYVNSKHGGEKEESHDPLPVLLSIHYGYDRIIEMDYYLGGKLVGVGIVDEGRGCLSSNYFYYDTDHLGRRPGVFSVLQEIELAKSMGKKYCYLGFYIKDNPKMSYKKGFRPNEILEEGRWREFTD